MEHERYMARALELAREALAEDEPEEGRETTFYDYYGREVLERIQRQK